MASMEIDEDAQSRQLAVYGREALLTLGTAKVLISGLNGLGVEIGALSVATLAARDLLRTHRSGCSRAPRSAAPSHSAAPSNPRTVPWYSR